MEKTSTDQFLGSTMATETSLAGHVCKFCLKVFDRPSRMESHMRSHTGEKPFKCSYQDCGKAFARKDHVVKHELTHTGTKNYKCQALNCDKAFITSSQLMRHMKTHENPNPYFCSLCSVGFSKKNILREHNLEQHCLAEFIYGCAKVFVSQSKLERHYDTHERRYICGHEDCAVVLSNYFLYRKHRALHRRESGSTFDRDTLKRKRSVFSNDGSNTGSDESESDELGDFDTEDDDFEFCHEVNSGRGTAVALDTDDKTVKRSRSDGGTDIQRFPCPDPQCGRSFTMMKNLNAHIRAVHDESNKLECPFGCGQKFGWKAVLDRHVRNIHVLNKVARRVQQPYKMSDQSPTQNELLGLSGECGNELIAISVTTS